MSKAELREELERVSSLLGRLAAARLTSAQRRLLQAVIDANGGDGLPRRVVETATGFDYMSREFYDEMSVLIHFNLVSHDPDLDDLVYLKSSDTWMSIKLLCDPPQHIPRRLAPQ